MKVSFCIPLSYRHISYLTPLLQSTQYYTEKPDEIVISASEVDSEYKWHIDSISKFKNVIFFETFDGLKKILIDLEERFESDPSMQFEENNLISRLAIVEK